MFFRRGGRVIEMSCVGVGERARGRPEAMDVFVAKARAALNVRFRRTCIPIEFAMHEVFVVNKNLNALPSNNRLGGFTRVWKLERFSCPLKRQAC